ncbi:hypothetical protein PLICRDRAFT_155572 [Plicaturopsis crispa FD-325 SS-3]|nr:hypothetical protein PLICRDRAFT_155572 [Plicaturopsis crispa FD-325 SS-3]
MSTGPKDKPMRLPQSLTDQAVLQDEPWCTFLVEREHSWDKERKNRVSDWKRRLADALQKTEGGVAAVQKWLGYAFKASPKESREVKKRKVTVDNRTLEVFIDFYWILRQGKDTDAMQRTLNNARTQRGFQYMPVVKISSGAEASTSVALSERRRSRKPSVKAEHQPSYAGAEDGRGQDKVASVNPIHTEPLCHDGVHDSLAGASTEEEKTYEYPPFARGSPMRVDATLPSSVADNADAALSVSSANDLMSSSTASHLNGTDTHPVPTKRAKRKKGVRRQSSATGRRSDSSDGDTPAASAPKTQRLTRSSTASRRAASLPSASASQPTRNTKVAVPIIPGVSRAGSYSSVTLGSAKSEHKKGSMRGAESRRDQTEEASAVHTVQRRRSGRLAVAKPSAASNPSASRVASPAEQSGALTNVNSEYNKGSIRGAESGRVEATKREAVPPGGRRRSARLNTTESSTTSDLKSASSSVTTKLPVRSRSSQPAAKRHSVSGRVPLRKKAPVLPSRPSKRSRTDDDVPGGLASVFLAPSTISAHMAETRAHGSDMPPSSVLADSVTSTSQLDVPAGLKSLKFRKYREVTSKYDDTVKELLTTPRPVAVNAMLSTIRPSSLPVERSEGTIANREEMADPAAPQRKPEASAVCVGEPPVTEFPAMQIHGSEIPSVPQSDLPPGITITNLKGLKFNKKKKPEQAATKSTNRAKEPVKTNDAAPPVLGKRKDSPHSVASEPPTLSSTHSRASLPSQRAINPLPRPSSALRSASARPTPASTSVAGPLPYLNSREVDQHLRDVAKSACEDNSYGLTQASWIEDQADQGDLSDSSDDEPLLRMLNESFKGLTACEVPTPRDVQPQLKPPLPRLPPIWAASRQEVCESFEWFRSYQGGVYFSNNVVKGYLLSAFASSRDAFEHDGRLIISHGGGKSESVHSKEGHSVIQQAQDQLANDKSVRALMKNYEDLRPLVLLADDRYSLFPYDLGGHGCAYAVLGFYQITHAWAEYQPTGNGESRVVRYKFSFQWCDGQGDPWWIPGGSVPSCGPSTPLVETSLGVKAPRPRPVKISHHDARPSKSAEFDTKCNTCGTGTPHIYEQGWMCLNPVCSAFWKIHGTDAPLLYLRYSETFLKLLPTVPLPPILRDIRPKLPVVDDGVTTSYASTRGWHCHDCGRLSSRRCWEKYECPHCKATHKVSGRVRSSKEFPRNIDGKVCDHRVSPGSGIIVAPSKLYSWGRGMAEYQQFILPNERGRIHVIRGNALANADANDIFEQYQVQAANASLLFRRWPLRTHKLRGPLLTNYFSQNSGEPYHYVGGTDNTVPFDEAPHAVVQALKLIRSRMTAAAGLVAPFNEILSAGYMERQKMAFHSDAEKGLGPMVASLSLGSSALMHFRLLSRFSPEKERGSRIALTLVLRHGDVMVMDGADIQTYYEHTVVPQNVRIAATARFIQPNLA